MFPSPIIFPLLLSQKVTYTPSFDTKSVSLDLPPIMCLSSHYPSTIMSLLLLGTPTRQNQLEIGGTQLRLGPMGLISTSKSLGIKTHFPLGTSNLLI